MLKSAVCVKKGAKINGKMCISLSTTDTRFELRNLNDDYILLQRISIYKKELGGAEHIQGHQCKDRLQAYLCALWQSFGWKMVQKRTSMPLQHRSLGHTKLSQARENSGFALTPVRNPQPPIHPTSSSCCQPHQYDVGIGSYSLLLTSGSAL